MRLRGLERGASLALPPAIYRCVPSEYLALSEEELDVVCTEALRGDACVFEMQLFDEPWVFGAVLVVEASWMVCDGIEGVHASEHKGVYTLALLSDAEQCASEAVWDRAPTVRLGALHRDTGVWTLGNARLAPHVLERTDVRDSLRDWRWAWGGSSWGPIWLEIQTRKDDAWLAAWLRTFAPLPYPAGSAPPEPGAPNNAFNGVFVRQGSLLFLRTHEDPVPAVAAIDAGLLARIAAGAVGDVTWDLVDGENGYFAASGEDAPSLGRYLDPAVDSNALREEWNALFKLQTVDARSASTEDAFWSVLSEALDERPCTSREAFVAAMRARAFTTLPRRLTILAAPALAERTQWFFGAVRSISTRLSWSMTFAADPCVLSPERVR